MQVEIPTVTTLLGLEFDKSKMLGLNPHISIAQQSLPRKALDHLKQNTNLSYSFLADCLRINLRTLQRYAPEQLFSQTVSERVLMIANVYAKGYEVFEDKDAFQKWMQPPVHALSNQEPQQLLPSTYGINLLLMELGRIEHGIFA
ncbi:type II RES/Xre toxin-antitoxin system antitoxin [Catalinimonas niigatensis]|uniref:type II RES/Xre toxin-antitoxin system antitoxin n=1 Tax=Catalinimonas niigatensis TaxID=1397264 RepID=UPI002666A0E7|nr:antitoxin Xre/MbcA/ParS toxin-binding domain-containing protein [Catalinimonas niigatensis]WPP52027.1 antitoxin Xre/MbcA/ParS toxin-binding domain-containing protein [Catalinimonas niigatensis]